jgi:hypothetical protein
MLFATDSCFWEHFERVFFLIQWDIRPIMEKYLWGITTEVQKELIHFDLTSFVPLNEAQLIPVNSKELKLFLEKNSFIEEYDIADQTLLYSCIRDGNQLLTDDGGLFLEAQALKIEVFNLPLFSLYLVRDELLSKKQAYRLLHHWEEQKCYPQRKIKRYFEVLKLI